MTARVSRAYRLFRPVTLLQGRRAYTAAELAGELQVSRRTVFRDLNMLEMAHIPYYSDPEARPFKLVRIRKLTPTQRTFCDTEDHDPPDTFGDAWSMIAEGECHDVHLHFAPGLAGNVAEVQWRHSQRVEWNEDGSIEFHARVDGVGEISWWPLGYGDQVEAIAPRVLRKWVARVASNVAQKYAKGEH